MIIAIDVKYYEKEKSAKAVGLLFNWEDEKQTKVIIKSINEINQYKSGEFYKRELPCIKAIMEDLAHNEIAAIIVDGYVFIDNNNGYGLGGHVYEVYNKKIPVIGVAKTPFFKNKETVKEIYRGKSKNPLYVSSIGINLEYASKKIQEMAGDYRIPTILRKVDGLTRI